MRICELKQREVINVKDCKRLGFVGDVDFDISTGKMLAIIVPGPGCVWGFLGREKEYIKMCIRDRGRGGASAGQTSR